MESNRATFIALAVALIRGAGRVYQRKWAFLLLFLCAFAISVWTLAALDLLPNPPKAEADASSEVEVRGEGPVPEVVEHPLTVEIPAIELVANVQNPESSDIAVLDEALHHGAVRHPSTAKLGEEGNVVLFGHSSYLPFVNNAAYKTFNDIQKLKAGDLIRVTGTEGVYVYHVRSVEKENTATGAIPLSVAGRVLTLATCNSFGAKEDRFIVTADFVESYPAAS